MSEESYGHWLEPNRYEIEGISFVFQGFEGSFVLRPKIVWMPPTYLVCFTAGIQWENRDGHSNCEEMWLEGRINIFLDLEAGVQNLLAGKTEKLELPTVRWGRGPSEFGFEIRRATENVGRRYLIQGNCKTRVDEDNPSRRLVELTIDFHFDCLFKVQEEMARFWFLVNTAQEEGYSGKGPSA